MMAGTNQIRDRWPRPRRFAAIILAAATLLSALIASQTVAQDDSDLVGEFSVSIAREDVPTDIAGAFSYVGRWRIAFNADGTYEAERLDTGVVIRGTYSVEGNQVTFTDESGLLSCANPSAMPIDPGDITTGTYDWTKTGNELAFTPVEDNCPGRLILLTTFPFNPYVACTTVPLSDAELAGTPEATPGPVEVPDTPVPLPVATGESPLDVLTPDATPVETSPAGTDGTPDQAGIAPEIDDLLSQLTACWASGDPSLWLPLLSQDFRNALISSDPNFETTLAASMSSPIVWERAGDIDIEGPSQVSAIVRSTVGIEEDFQRFVFVLEDGEWKWNG